LFEHRHGVGPSQGFHLGSEPFPQSSHRRLRWFDPQLVLVAADVESQKVEALVEVDDSRLVLVEGRTSGRQPC
jgi:hypothetical protein